MGATGGAAPPAGGEASTCARLRHARRVTIEMPASWVPPLVLQREVLDARVPLGARKTVYHRSEHELFALFGEAAKFDGVVERLVVYADDARQIKTEARALHRSRVSYQPCPHLRFSQRPLSGVCGLRALP